MMLKQPEKQGELLYELSEDERRLILAYRSGKAMKLINFLISQEELPSSFPKQPDMH